MVYLRDSGLRHALLGFESIEPLQKWQNEASWKSFVIEQLLSLIDTEGVAYKASHFRTSDGYHLDLVLEIAGKVWAFQITQAESVDQEETNLLRKTADLIGADYRVLLSRTAHPMEHDRHAIANLDWLFEEFKDVRLW